MRDKIRTFPGVLVLLQHSNNARTKHNFMNTKTVIDVVRKAREHHYGVEAAETKDGKAAIKVARSELRAFLISFHADMGWDLEMALIFEGNLEESHDPVLLS